MSARRRRPVEPGEWLMQPRWLPMLRASIGGACIVGALAALVLAWPWRGWDVALILVWLGYGVFLIWASRFERSGTRLTADKLVVTVGRRVVELQPTDVLDLRPDQPGPQAWRVQAVLRDGETLTLLGVPPEELPRFQRWHTGV